VSRVYKNRNASKEKSKTPNSQKESQKEATSQPNQSKGKETKQMNEIQNAATEFEGKIIGVFFKKLQEAGDIFKRLQQLENTDKNKKPGKRPLNQVMGTKYGKSYETDSISISTEKEAMKSFDSATRSFTTV